jgi:hypothetical protein
MSDIVLRVFAVIGIGAAIAAPLSIVEHALNVPPYVGIPVLIAVTLSCAWPIVKPYVRPDYGFWKYAAGLVVSQSVIGALMYFAG